MIRAAKVGTIARWELACVVRRVGFMLFTFGMPLVMGLLFGGVGALGTHAVAEQQARGGLWGLVDAAHLGMSGDATFVIFGDEPAARRALDQKQLAGYFVLEPQYLEKGAVRLVARGDGPAATLGTSQAERALGKLLRRHLLAGKLPDRVVARVIDPIVAERTMVSEHGAEHMDDAAELHHITVPLLLAMLMLMSLTFTSSYLVQGVAIEKENKLVEVLLSAASADEILAGKLLGLGAAGLVQVGVWCGMLLTLALPVAGHALAGGLYVPWHAIAAAVPLFLLGYLFVGSLMLATGSLGSTMRESQQLAVLWVLPTMIPMLLMSALIPEPHGVLARVLTWIPFTAPLTIVTRLSMDPDGIALWEMLGAALLLVACTWLAVHVAARLFRVGLLLTGARPKLRDVLRQARATARPGST